MYQKLNWEGCVRDSEAQI